MPKVSLWPRFDFVLNLADLYKNCRYPICTIFQDWIARKPKLYVCVMSMVSPRLSNSVEGRHFAHGIDGLKWLSTAFCLWVLVWPQCPWGGEGKDAAAPACLPPFFSGEPRHPLCCGLFWEAGQSGGPALTELHLWTQHNWDLVRAEGRCCGHACWNLHRLLLCQRAYHDTEVCLWLLLKSSLLGVRGGTQNYGAVAVALLNCFPFAILSLVSLCQFAQSAAASRCKLSASDGHADSPNVLLFQPGPGSVPHLPYRDPENHLQSGNLLQLTGQTSLLAHCLCMCD